MCLLENAREGFGYLGFQGFFYRFKLIPKTMKVTAQELLPDYLLNFKMKARHITGDSFNVTLLIVTIGVLLITTLDMIGWLSGVKVLTGYLQGWTPMKFITAICLNLSAVSLLLIRFGPRYKRWISVPYIAGFFIILVALTELADHFKYMQTGSDAEWTALPVFNLICGSGNRMAVLSAIQLIIFAIVLFLLTDRTRRSTGTAHLLVIPVFILGYLVPLCYILNAQDMIFNWGGTTIALNTGISFCLLGIGALATDKETWLMKVYSSAFAGSIIVRRMLPAMLLLPIVVAWLSLLGMKTGTVTATEWAVLLAIIYTAFFFMLLLLTAKSVNKYDRIRKDKEAEIIKSNKRLEILSSTARNLLKSDRPDKIVDDLCRKILDYLDCHVFFNFLMIDEPQPHLELNACGGIPESNKTALKYLELGVAVCGCVARDGYPIVIENIQQNNDQRANLVRKFGVQAYACHPLLDKGAVIGTLSFGTKTRVRFTPDEIALMKVVTDEVAIAMARKKSEEEIIQLNQNLEMHVEERTQKLAESLKEMEAFTYSVSHDLRAPLRHIAGYVGLVNKKSQGKLDPSISKYLNIISESAVKMGILIDDILDFAKLSRAQLSFHPVKVSDLVRDVLEMTSQDCKSRKIKFEIGDLPVVEGDPAMLRIVLMNLITNSIKFTGQKKEACICIGESESEAPDGDFFTIFVKDNGTGFEMQYVNKLFSMFQRLHDENEFPGTGLGLAITKKIIERHGGRIWAEGSPGNGAAFYFTLPKSIREPQLEASGTESKTRTHWP